MFGGARKFTSTSCCTLPPGVTIKIVIADGPERQDAAVAAAEVAAAAVT